MTAFQKVITRLAMAFALFLAISIIGGVLSVVGLLGGYSENDAVTETMTPYTISSDIQNLTVNIRAANLTIRQGDHFSVESNLKHLTVEETNGVLSVKETEQFSVSSNRANPALILTIPADTVFKNATVKTGAGKVTADCLSADTVNLDFGAGEVTVGTLSAFSGIRINGGAGKTTVSGGSLCNLTLDMGAGQLNLTSTLTGNSKFDMGVGESNITVIGSKNDYTLDIEKGIGNITVDGTPVSDIRSQGSGNNRLEIDGGVGAVNVNFQKANKV